MEQETITFAVRVQTTGWVGFGLSPNGQMPNSDVVIGWVKGEESYFDVSCQLRANTIHIQLIRIDPAWRGGDDASFPSVRVN